MKTTATLFNIMQSELIQKGYNEFVDETGRLIYYDKEHQIMSKLLRYDEQVSSIMNDLFSSVSLENPSSDTHFKKMFLTRFLNRQIGSQTVDLFQAKLLTQFMVEEVYLNHLYEDLEKFLTGEQFSTGSTNQSNVQQNDGTSVTDNRQAFSDLPQDGVQLDVDNNIMKNASDNTISRNKQKNAQQTTGETSGSHQSTVKSYNLEALQKSGVLLQDVLNRFDRACFLQIW